MRPFQLHWHVDESTSAGTSLTVTLDDPGDHSPAMTGKHDCGTSVPAADEAACTAGFWSDRHRPKGGTFAGPVSLTTPAGVEALTLCPLAANVDGTVPIEHCNVAPVETIFGIQARSHIAPPAAQPVGDGNRAVASGMHGQLDGRPTLCRAELGREDIHRPRAEAARAGGKEGCVALDVRGHER